MYQRWSTHRLGPRRSRHCAHERLARDNVAGSAPFELFRCGLAGELDDAERRGLESARCPGRGAGSDRIRHFGDEIARCNGSRSPAGVGQELEGLLAECAGGRHHRRRYPHRLRCGQARRAVPVTPRWHPPRRWRGNPLEAIDRWVGIALWIHAGQRMPWPPSPPECAGASQSGRAARLPSRCPATAGIGGGLHLHALAQHVCAVPSRRQSPSKPAKQ